MSKTIDGVVHQYIYSGTQLQMERWGGNWVEYFYDENGNPTYMLRYDEAVGFPQLNYFVTNLQGDVIAVCDNTHAPRFFYSYDAWGKLLSVKDANGNDVSQANNAASWNILRYRGYVYDRETGFYYVSSRYYDPEIGRFINADDTDYIGADGSALSYNLFAYCLNDPVNRFDVDGNWSLPNWAKVAIGAVALAGAVALTVATGGGAAAVAVGVAKVVGSVAVSTAVSAGVGYLNNGKQGAIDGACNGFMFGSLSACGGAALKYVKVSAATTGSPNSMGQAGERLAGIDCSTKQPINVNGRVRIPDAMTDSVLKEVKNVKYISNTQQLRDFATYANATGKTLELWVRPTTKVAKTVISAGWNIRYLW